MIPLSWHITLFGELRAQRGEHIITRFKYQKVGGLLAYLAYHPHQMHARDILVELFWPESDPETGRNNLSVALSSLRHQFEPPGTPANSVIRADRYSVGLNPAAIGTDVALFERALRDAGKAASPMDRRQRLEAALELYRGPLLPGYYEVWIESEQERLAGLYSDGAGALIRLLETEGDLTAALQVARQQVSVDRLREDAYPPLLRLLAAVGQPGAALRQYKELERLLEEELGEEPSAPLRALARQIEKESGLAAAAIRPLATRPRQAVVPAPVAVPSGMPATVTFLLTDIEGSTRLWEQTGEAFKSALERHHQLLRQEFARHRGQELKEAGDSFLVAFASVKSALACAIACQQCLLRQEWPEALGGATGRSPLQVRMALHTGDVEFKEGEYHGVTLHRASRMLTAGHGGQILVSEATTGLLRRDLEEEVRLVDLGVYRLRDVPTPERLFQVDYPGMATHEFGPLAAEAGYASHLPWPVTRFFGRQEEIQRLEGLLTGEQARLVTLTGPGGTGKTRLAVEAARYLEPGFAGAVWFVALGDLADPRLIPDTILVAMKLPRSPDREPLDQVTEALSRQPSLLVLDGFEHLVEGGAQAVKELLERAPPLTCLVTSRQLLGLSGEHPFPVPPLPTPNGPEAPETLSLYDSVRLFVDRAQSVKPDFQVTSLNAPAVAELCLRLEGIPLAIELAASRALVLSPLQMLGQLEDRFRFLRSRRRDIEERHRTLSGTIEWSYRLLGAEVQRFYRRLSVFRGGWTVEAAERICEEPLALDYLAQLQECSLVLSGESAETGEMRFRMLDTIREYGQERLQEASEEPAVRQRHAEVFVTLAEAAEPKLKGPEQGEWLNRLEAEHDNCRAALAWSQAQAEDRESGLRLAGALMQFWQIRGYWNEGRQWVETMLAESRGIVRTILRAKALNGAGLLATHQGDYETARAFHEESLALVREIGDRRGISASLNNLGLVARNQGEYGVARSLYEEALNLNREMGNRAGMASNLVNLGYTAFDQGDYAVARTYCEESLALRRETGDKEAVADSLYALGTLDYSQGDYASAHAYLEEGLAIYREIGSKPGIACVLSSVGNLAFQQGNLSLARAHYEEGLAIFREIGDKANIALLLGHLGVIGFEQGDSALSHTYMEEGLALYREIGDKDGIAGSLNNLGVIAYKQGDYPLARSRWEESLSLSRELGSRLQIADSLENFGSLAIARGQSQRAAQLLGAAAALREAIGAPVTPHNQPSYEEELARLRETLGEEACTSFWEAGRRMPWEAAVAYALETPG